MSLARTSRRRITSDPGTVSAAHVDARGVIVGYLNATPQQADESLSNWAAFRPHHNAHEGDRHVRVLAAARALRFGSGRASCVIDTYGTSRAPYREIACLVQGARHSTGDRRRRDHGRLATRAHAARARGPDLPDLERLSRPRERAPREAGAGTRC
jgi:hypothetical protein